MSIMTAIWIIAGCLHVIVGTTLVMRFPYETRGLLFFDPDEHFTLFFLECLLLFVTWPVWISKI